MNPIHKEKYVLSKDTYGNFTIDQNKPKLESNKRKIRITAVVQMLVGSVFIGSVIVAVYLIWCGIKTIRDVVIAR